MRYLLYALLLLPVSAWGQEAAFVTEGQVVTKNTIVCQEAAMLGEILTEDVKYGHAAGLLKYQSYKAAGTCDIINFSFEIGAEVATVENVKGLDGKMITYHILEAIVGDTTFYVGSPIGYRKAGIES